MADPARSIVRARLGATGYAVDIEAGPHRLRADEPGELGGTDSGPDPFALLLSALASCVLITVAMYARRKGWPLEGLRATLTPTRESAKPLERVRIELKIDGALDAEQRARLLEIAGRCPMHRTLEAGVHIETAAAEG